MKGKGKGMSSVREKDKDKEAARDESKDCPLNFPDMKPVDHTRMCPRYTAVLGRTEDDGIGIEELDTLQTELETLLASVAKRMRLLEHEIQVLVSWQEKKDVKKGVSSSSSNTTPGKMPDLKRGKGSEERPSKKFKSESSGKGSITPTVPGRPGKNKHVQNKVQDLDFVDSPVELPRIPKNEAPSRFWTTVEPYCADITSEDLKVLEEILRSHEDDADYYKIPSLGKHFSQKWAQEDILEEQREGHKISDKRRGLSNNNNSNCNEVAALLKKAETNGDTDDNSPFGPLTQRLVSALIEENIMTPLDDATMAEAAEAAATMSPRSLAKQLNIGNPAQLERRIKRELEEQGILEVEDKSDDNPDDEILMELRKKQQELKALSQHNYVVTKRLFKMAKDEMARQELRKKMAAADTEVMDAFRKIQAARQKKRTPTKKERDAALKAIKDRESIVKSLESMETFH